MNRAELRQEIKDIDLELKERSMFNSPLQLRAYRRRRSKLHRMLDDHAFTAKHMTKQQLSLSL